VTILMENYLEEFQAAREYLRLSRIHAEYLGGLRWSGTEDALIDEQNRPFAFTEAIAEFVDGFASGGRVIPFGYLLHWMDLFQNRRSSTASAVVRLHKIVAEKIRDWRFAGALAAALSDDVPEVAEPPDLQAVSKRLRNRAFPIRWFTSQFHETTYPPVRPPMDPADFERQIIRKLEAYSDDELRTWLRTGRGPIRQAERLADEPPLPRSLARVLASLIERPRLAGAQPYVPQLVGALSLPARRFVPQELPVGGYSDIVTRGQVEHLLPTQFALDELEFLRRFAEKELLYFRREEPPAQERQELVVLVDQGVRTWGDVRLVLAAAALAFGKQAVIRKTPFFLAATSNGGHIIDPTEENADVLGELLEASDLSLNPGLALERTLETPCDPQRDVVLLTHPRSLREEDVLNAARRLAARDRLFAVALDAKGDVAVSEIRHGAAIKLRQFHIDFAPSQPPLVRPHREEAGPTTQWTGDVETIPFPFRLGTEPHVTHVDFDYGGHCLLTVSGQGTLHLWKLDGSGHEMLPRARRGTVMKEVVAVIGVAGGFVVGGKIDGSLMLAHYDVVRRRSDIFDFGRTVANVVSLEYFPENHHVSITAHPGFFDFGLDLATRKTATHPIIDAGASLPLEVSIATSVSSASSSNRDLLRLGQIPESAGSGNAFLFDFSTSAFTVRKNREPNITFTPLADGKACFVSVSPDFGAQQTAGNTLVFRAQRKDIGDSITLMQYPNGAILREYQAVRPNHKITRHLLSYDGNRIALLRSDHRVEVDPVFDRSLPSLCTRVGGYTMEAQLRVGKHCLLLNLGSSRQFWHLFDWSTGTLEYHYERRPLRELSGPLMSRLTNRDLDDLSPEMLPSCAADDPERYIGGSSRHLWVVLDRFGQVAVLDREERLVAMFIAFRDRHAAWMPDGTRLGNLTLSLGPPSPDAAQRIGQALLAASA
jgi:MoxR-vWA-beta-propeller ternary system domain bpX1